MSTQFYVATVNTPGCLPDTYSDDIPVFDSIKEAWKYQAEERTFEWDVTPIDECNCDCCTDDDSAILAEQTQIGVVSLPSVGRCKNDPHDLGRNYSVSPIDHDSQCGHCERTWNSTETPTPSARCPYEYEHEH